MQELAQPIYSVRIQRLDATIADLRLTFAPLPPEAEVRGRLMGPRRPGVSTIEIAYALRPIGKPPTEYQVLIPDPCFWSEAQPFVYEGPVEFFQNGVKVDSVHVSVSVKEPGRHA